MLKKLVRKGIKYLTSADYRFLINSGIGCYGSMADEEYLKRKFRVSMGKVLNPEAPKTFREKFQWIILMRLINYGMVTYSSKIQQFYLVNHFSNVDAIKKVFIEKRLYNG